MIIRFWRGFNRVKRGGNGGLFAFMEDFTFQNVKLWLNLAIRQVVTWQLHFSKAMEGATPTPLTCIFFIACLSDFLWLNI